MGQKVHSPLRRNAQQHVIAVATICVTYSDIRLMIHFDFKTSLTRLSLQENFSLSGMLHGNICLRRRYAKLREHYCTTKRPCGKQLKHYDVLERERWREKIAFFACRRLNVWMLDRHCIPRGYIDKKLSARTLNFEKIHVHTSPYFSTQV